MHDIKNRLYVNSNKLRLNQTRNRDVSDSPVRGQNRLFVMRPLDAVFHSYRGTEYYYILPQWLNHLLADTEDLNNVWISVSWLQRIAQSDVGLLSWTDSPRWNWRI